MEDLGRVDTTDGPGRFGRVLVVSAHPDDRRAAAFLGVRDVVFLGFRDGQLTADVELRRAIADEIRRFRPELVLTHLPMRALSVGISHPDHLAVGEATLAAVDADAHSFRHHPELLPEGLAPHRVREVWMPGLEETDHYVDVTATVARQVKAVLCHRSQFLSADGQSDGSTRWAPERLAMVSSMRAQLRQLGERSGRGYRFAARLRRVTTG